MCRWSLGTRPAGPLLGLEPKTFQRTTNAVGLSVEVIEIKSVNCLQSR
jgi:hypothetical protein